MVSKLTKYEITRLISARAQQISCGAPALVKVKDSTAYSIAKRNLILRLCHLQLLET